MTWSFSGLELYYGEDGGVRRVTPGAAGGAEEFIARPPSGPVWPLSMGPDGTALLGRWTTVSGRSVDLVLMSGDGASPALRDFLVADWHEVAGAISPDGKWVAYASNESGEYEVYVRRLSDAGGQVRASTAGGFGPRWSRDGAALYYQALRSADPAVFRVAVRSGDGFQAATPQIVFQGSFLPSPATFASANFDIHPDGSRLVIVQPVGGRTLEQRRVYLLANWFDELRRRASN